MDWAQKSPQIQASVQACNLGTWEVASLGAVDSHYAMTNISYYFIVVGSKIVSTP